MRVLACDATPEFPKSMHISGTRLGFTVSYLASGKAPLRQNIENNPYDAIIIGTLKDAAQLDVIKDASLGSSMPIVAMVEHDQRGQIEHYYRMGADLVFVYGTNPVTIWTAIETINRKRKIVMSGGSAQNFISFGLLQVDLLHNLAYDGTRSYAILPRRASVLRLWHVDKDRVVSIKEMMDAVYGTSWHPATDRLHTRMIELQKWLDKVSRFTVRIAFIREQGYQLRIREIPLQSYVWPVKHVIFNMLKRKLTIQGKDITITRHNLELVYELITHLDAFIPTRKLAQLACETSDRTGLRRIRMRMETMRTYFKAHGFPNLLEGMHGKGYRILNPA